MQPSYGWTATRVPQSCAPLDPSPKDSSPRKPGLFRASQGEPRAPWRRFGKLEDDQHGGQHTWPADAERQDQTSCSGNARRRAAPGGRGQHCAAHPSPDNDRGEIHAETVPSRRSSRLGPHSLLDCRIRDTVLPWAPDASDVPASQASLPLSTAIAQNTRVEQELGDFQYKLLLDLTKQRERSLPLKDEDHAPCEAALRILDRELEPRRKETVESSLTHQGRGLIKLLDETLIDLVPPLRIQMTIYCEAILIQLRRYDFVKGNWGEYFLEIVHKTFCILPTGGGTL